MEATRRTDEERDVVVRRALADRRRLAVMRELRATPDGLDVEELARRLGVHPNTVRWHLGVLADAGLIASRSAGARGPGRPRILYRVRVESGTDAGGEHRVLATILADALAASETGGARAEAAGQAWGRHTVTPEAKELGVADAVARVVDLLELQGFDPVASGCSITMRRCPFHDLAEAHTEVVCAAHRGLVAGALEELRAPVAVRALRPFVEPDSCVLELAP